MCAGVCKDTQHRCYFAITNLAVKRFLLLRNINFIVERIRITKAKRIFSRTAVICITKCARRRGSARFAQA